MIHTLTAAEVSKSIAGIPFPMDRDSIIDIAREANAPLEVIAFLQELPNREYTSPTEIMREIGKTPETRDEQEIV